jgi:hypothetical protein
MRPGLALATLGLVVAASIGVPASRTACAQPAEDVVVPDGRRTPGILAMFERWLGAERFRDGIRRHLAAHRPGNPTVEARRFG